MTRIREYTDMVMAIENYINNPEHMKKIRNVEITPAGFRYGIDELDFLFIAPEGKVELIQGLQVSLNGILILKTDNVSIYGSFKKQINFVVNSVKHDLEEDFIKANLTESQLMNRGNPLKFAKWIYEEKKNTPKKTVEDKKKEKLTEDEFSNFYSCPTKIQEDVD